MSKQEAIYATPSIDSNPDINIHTPPDNHSKVDMICFHWLSDIATASRAMVINIVCIDIISALATIPPSDGECRESSKKKKKKSGISATGIFNQGPLLMQNLYYFNQFLRTLFFKLYASLNSIVLKRLCPPLPVRRLRCLVNNKSF